MNSIVITNGTVAFSTETEPGYYSALRDVNFEIERGEFVAVVGANGSGKSTLAKVVSRLLPLSRGTIKWPNVFETLGRVEKGTASGLSDSPTATMPVQMVFQNPDAQIVGETVYEDICFGLENFGIPADQMRTRAQQALKRVGLHVHLTQLVNNLSGGQKQLLCIASCLAVGAQVLVFDEATAMLNPAARQRILELAQRLQQDGVTILWVTQWLEEAAQARRIVALQGGGIFFDGTPREFFYGTVSDSVSDSKTPSCEADGVITRAQTPCELLQLKPPYVVEVSQALAASGTFLPVTPLTLQELAEGVQQLCQLQ
ncbi:ATP-binding cassette domain-containing protein [Alicyclobacillus sp. SO9]|uniref:ATP-binding cassette domain-containing protein n=1 Tax=Alicyclobacillus sp. SO9 TaxID=2665646 RepID=UPI0018E6F03B|nr:ATP-binding cassette domain-containing protein [Alicyclobacillus sp. SO9]